MGNEREFGKRVRALLKGAGCACYPVETGGTAVGFPDMVVLHGGGVSFVELKSRGKTMLARLDSNAIEGPGQRAFARNVARKSAFTQGQCTVAQRSFLLVECMDGIALMVEEGKCAYLASCWEDMPSGTDLRDALRAWRVSVMPSEAMMDGTVGDCYSECASRYSILTGILPSLAGIRDAGMTLADAGGRDKALEIARDICDRGRLSLLMDSMKAEEGEGYFAPVEGGGFVKIAKGV